MIISVDGMDAMEARSTMYEVYVRVTVSASSLPLAVAQVYESLTNPPFALTARQE